MKVLVIGAGALGGLVGALLTEKGHEALLLTRTKAPRAIRIEGGAYGPDRVVPVRAETVAPPEMRPDLVIIGVKTQDLAAALHQHGAAFGEAVAQRGAGASADASSAPVVALQNGLAQDEIVTAAVGPARAVAAVVALDAEHTQPGVVRCDRKGTLLIGAPRKDGRSAADRAAAILSEVVRVDPIDNVAGARWTKLLVNLQNVIPALTGLSYQETAKHPQLARAVIRMVREARQVADAEKVTLAPLPWTNPMLLRALSRLPEAIATPLYAKRVEKVLGTKPAYGSTWQSMQRGQSLETDHLNGEVVRRGRARGVPTPVNARAVELAAKGAPMSPDACAAALLEA